MADEVVRQVLLAAQPTKRFVTVEQVAALTAFLRSDDAAPSAPILHKAGDIAREFLGTQRWWINKGSSPVDLTSADIVDGK